FAETAHPRKRAYLAAYVQEGGDTARARKTAGGGGHHSDWMRGDAEYRAAFLRAKLAVAERAEEAIYRRARRGRSDAQLIDALTRLRRAGYGAGPRWPKKVGSE